MSGTADVDRGRSRGPLRRLLLLILLLALAWTTLIIVLIATNPVPGTGNPMD